MPDPLVQGNAAASQHPYDKRHKPVGVYISAAIYGRSVQVGRFFDVHVRDPRPSHPTEGK